MRANKATHDQLMRCKQLCLAGKTHDLVFSMTRALGPVNYDKMVNLAMHISVLQYSGVILH